MGAGERMRNWITEQLEVVVSVKEAVKTRQQMMSDRKTLTKQLNDVKKTMRETLTREEIEENNKKLKELQEALDERNMHLNNLQRQIADLEQEGSRDGRTRASGIVATCGFAHAFGEISDVIFLLFLYGGGCRSRSGASYQLYNLLVSMN